MERGIWREDAREAREGEERRRQAPGRGAPRQAALRRAEAKARFARRAIHCAVTVALLALFSRPLAFVVGFFWGLSLLSELGRDFVEPKLRQRHVEREVERATSAAVRGERRAARGAQERDLGSFSASVAAEIREPLRSARDLVRRMGEDPAADESVEHARAALAELERVERSITHLLRTAREGDRERGARGGAEGEA